MGQCSISFENATIIKHRSAPDHLDVDYMAIIWIVDNIPTTRVYPLGDRNTGINLLADGSLLKNIFDSIECGDGSLVSATVVVMNVSAVSPDQQVNAATQFALNAANQIAQLYVQVACKVLGIVGDISGAPAVATVIAAAASAVLEQLVDAMSKAIGDLFTGTLNPLLSQVLSEAAWLVDGFANCNGEVLHDVFVFAPKADADGVTTKTYTVSQSDSHCGNAQTTARWWIHRDVDAGLTPLNNVTVPGLIYALPARMMHTPGYGASDDRLVHDLSWYNHLGYTNGAAQWQGPRPIGEMWNFQQVSQGIQGTLYAVDSAGDLHWYRNTGYRTGMNQWAGPQTIQHGWSIPTNSPGPNDLLGFFCDPRQDSLVGVEGPHFVPMTQVIYAVKADGTLLWYRHEQPITGAATWTNGGTGQAIGSGWVSGYRLLFGGGGGILYLVADDSILYWYKHTGFETGSNDFAPRQVVTTGWDIYKAAFSIGGGIIYAVGNDGKLYWFQHVDYGTGGKNLTGPNPVGSDWDTGDVTSLGTINLHALAL